jgi:hypothetical protein
LLFVDFARDSIEIEMSDPFWMALSFVAFRKPNVANLVAKFVEFVGTHYWRPMSACDCRVREAAGDKENFAAAGFTNFSIILSVCHVVVVSSSIYILLCCQQLS